MAGSGRARVVVVGGGFGGAYAAQELCRTAGREIDTVLIDRNNFLTFYPLLIEAAVGAIEPRHVVFPLRPFVRRGEFMMADVTEVDLARNRILIHLPHSGETRQVTFDHLVLAPGSVTRMPSSIQGLAEHGFELKSLSDAIQLRDRVIQLFEQAITESDPEVRRRLLTFVIVGGNFTGAEYAGELEAYLADLRPEYPGIGPDEGKVYLVEHGPRLLPALSESGARYCTSELRRRGVDVRVNESVTAVGPDHAVLRSGERIETKTVVWTAGIAPPPLLERIRGLPLTPQGYVPCDLNLRVQGFENVWCLGDAATVLDPSGQRYPATAQNAVRMGPHVARNIIAAVRGKVQWPYSFKSLGVFCVLGRRRAYANIKGFSLYGFLAYILFRGAYLSKIPGFRSKMRLMSDWLNELLWKTPAVQFGWKQPEVSAAGSPDPVDSSEQKTKLRS